MRKAVETAAFLTEIRVGDVVVCVATELTEFIGLWKVVQVGGVYGTNSILASLLEDTPDYSKGSRLIFLRHEIRFVERPDE